MICKISGSALIGAVFVWLTALPAGAAPPVVLGWVEHVRIPAIASTFKTKLDTGATTSSLRAEVLSYTGTPHTDTRRVVFQIETDAGETQTLERRLVRYVRIKMKDGTVQRRPVIEMEFCLAGQRLTGEVNLASRADFLYPVLIGRNMLQGGHIAVDASRTFTSDAPCPASPAPEAETAPDASPAS